jgi:hypothetical protein
MRYFDNYTHIVAIKEMSSGNESVGNMWMETKVFSKDTPIDAIVQWARDVGGKLIITISEPENKS